jgi:hypothetical protein
MVEFCDRRSAKTGRRDQTMYTPLFAWSPGIYIRYVRHTCVYTNAYIHVHVYVSGYRHTYTFIHVGIPTYIYIHVCIHTCVCEPYSEY